MRIPPHTIARLIVSARGQTIVRNSEVLAGLTDERSDVRDLAAIVADRMGIQILDLDGGGTISTGAVKDWRQLEEWPEVRVIQVAQLAHNPTPDGNPHAQLVNLSCGHQLVSTWAEGEQPRYWPGRRIRCRTCGVGDAPTTT